MYIKIITCVYTNMGRLAMKTSVRMTSIRLDTKLADDAVKALGASNRSEAVHMALREVVALKKFKQLMSKYGGKLEFEAHGK
jgi:Arc/MetJ family transcription regulator